MSMQTAPPVVIAYVADLMFGSKLSAIARSAGVKLRNVRSADAITSGPGRALIVDLELPDALEAATKWIETTGLTALGFGSHVDAQRLRAARVAGLDPVLTRSQLATHLPGFLVKFAQPTGDAK